MKSAIKSGGPNILCLENSQARIGLRSRTNISIIICASSACNVPLRTLAPAAMHPYPLLRNAANLLFDIGGHESGERDRIVVATRFHRLVESQVLLAAAPLNEAGDDGGTGPNGQLGRSNRRGRRSPEKRDLHTLGADVLIDEEAEEPAALDGRHHGPRSGGRSAINGVNAGP